MTTRRLPTTAEISRRAGVDKSTVSRALKSDPRISRATRERIVAIAESMGYAPNALAQSLATSNSDILAFVGHESQNYWYQENIQKLVRQATLSGLQLMVFQVLEGGTIEDVVPEMIRYRVAGAVVIPQVGMTEETADRLARFGITTVLLNRAGAPLGVSSVRQDQAEGARGIAHFLALGGHERIAFIAGSTNPAAQDRARGFRQGLSEAGASLFAEDVGHFTFRGAFGAATRLLIRPDRPDAVFAANDMMALATIEAARALDITLPGELSVIGYDNGRVGAWPGFRLTTVAQPIEDMFAHALGIVLARRKAPELEPEAVWVDAELLIRGSARIPDQLDALPIGYRFAPEFPG